MIPNGLARLARTGDCREASANIYSNWLDAPAPRIATMSATGRTPRGKASNLPLVSWRPQCFSARLLQGALKAGRLKAGLGGNHGGRTPLTPAVSLGGF